MSRWLGPVLCILCVSAVGCGDDDDGGGGVADAATPDAVIVDAAVPDAGLDAAIGDNAGFIAPNETLVAYKEIEGVWTEIGPANYDCLETPSTDEPTTVPVALTGRSSDWQTGDAVLAAEIAFFDYPDLGVPLVTVTTDSNGEYSVSLPAGTGRLAVRASHDEFHAMTTINAALAPDAPEQTLDVNIVSPLTLNALPAFIGVMRTPGLALGVGTTLDCDGNHVGGAIATVSSSSGTPAHREGATTYYFSAGSTSLPVRHSQASATNKDGMFMTIEVAPRDSAFVQVWGFPTPADLATGNLVLLCELTAPLTADALFDARCEPRRSPAQ